MRESRVLNKIRKGGVASCFKLNLWDGQAADLAAGMGFDCLWVDREHQTSDWNVINAMNWAAKSHDTDLVVRVGRGSYSDYIRPLEMDAAGIIVPHIMNTEDAKRIVNMTRFHPVGRRPVDGGNADGFYTGINFKDYLAQANEKRFTILQIEDPEPLDELETIAQVKGYDMLFFGPGDFSHGIGAPGDWKNPLVTRTRKRIAEVAREHGKFAGTTCGPDDIEEYADMGYQFLNIGADVVGLIRYCSELVTRFNDSMKDKNA